MRDTYEGSMNYYDLLNALNELDGGFGIYRGEWMKKFLEIIQIL